MRVLYLYKDYFPVLGGIENHIRQLAVGLRGMGVETQVLVTNTTRRTVQEELDGVPVVKTARLLNLSSAPISLSFYPWLRRLEKQIDIAHAHMPYPPGELGQLLCGRSRRFVVTYHSDIVRQRVLGALYRPFLWQVLRRADRIAVSNPVYIQDSPFLRVHADKCRVIHFGVDLERFAQTPTVEAQAARWRARWPGRQLVLFVGRLRHYKGVNVLIDAAARLPDQAEFLIVGVGPLAEALHRQAQHSGVAERVHFLGELSDEEVTALYHAADVFVLPSTNRAETFGIVQLEAMACGLPVICTELGTGTSYVNQHGVTGLVVPPNDPEALAAALQQLLEHPEQRRAFGAAGRRRIEQAFTRQEMLRRTLALYEEVLQ
ncbi:MULTISPECIES: glycosyltransferase [Caldilinea]|jgi:rhamnosyl/mannosyltransferase|uniref:Putative glycosyltransferase n=1 Tax=Caldilinea aerophila (strain DSM 14535 / JCM 11387 / NBRC 104270 / STL-6-O1) TaxID=926550 RepID=I0I1E1_CALAS|nr:MULTISPECIES: glycosyltransferase [Caldilinea]BAL99078.1 putative glycosyltransferase [Caldilinea aerophila DSM 14535 = NBRC 104270]GIV74330.1 MAG: glycosyl transferase family 1 [Caldilinea sp.]